MPDAPTSFQTGNFQRGNETPLTYRLKWAAWEWLYTMAQCRCVGMEVRLEGPAGRVVNLVGVGNLVRAYSAGATDSVSGRKLRQD